MTKLFTQSETITPETVCDYLSGQQLGELVRQHEQAQLDLKDSRAITRFKAMLLVDRALKKALAGVKKFNA